MKLIFVIVGLIGLANAYSLPNSNNFQYKHHDNNEVEIILKSIKRACPDITRVFSLSERSVLGKKILGIVFGRVPDKHRALTPEFKYVGGIHGNEVIGKEVLLSLANYLCEAYNNNDPEVRRLIHLTRIHILPALNPDGWQTATEASYKDRNEITGRANNNSVDLNRNYPKVDKLWLANKKTAPWNNHHLLYNPTTFLPLLEPETRALMKWAQTVPFVLSGALHAGDLVVNYPFDAPTFKKQGIPSKTPDEDLFQQLASSYAEVHPSMMGSKCYPDEPGFPAGIVNGAAWYIMRGGMEDYNYLATNCFEVIMEIGCVKYPNETSLPKVWADNKKSLVNYMWQTHLGIKGIVKNAETGVGIPDVEIQIKAEQRGKWVPIWHFVTTAGHGDYYRLLLDGKYKVTARKDGYLPQIKIVDVVNQYKKSAMKVDFALTQNEYL